MTNSVKTIWKSKCGRHYVEEHIDCLYSPPRISWQFCSKTRRGEVMAEKWKASGNVETWLRGKAKARAKSNYKEWQRLAKMAEDFRKDRSFWLEIIEEMK